MGARESVFEATSERPGPRLVTKVPTLLDVGWGELVVDDSDVTLRHSSFSEPPHPVDLRVLPAGAVLVVRYVELVKESPRPESARVTVDVIRPTSLPERHVLDEMKVRCREVVTMVPADRSNLELTSNVGCNKRLSTRFFSSAPMHEPTMEAVLSSLRPELIRLVDE